MNNFPDLKIEKNQWVGTYKGQLYGNRYIGDEINSEELLRTNAQETYNKLIENNINK